MFNKKSLKNNSSLKNAFALLMVSLLLVLVGNSYKVFAYGVKELSTDLTEKTLGEFECANQAQPTTDEVLKAVKKANPNVDEKQLTVTFDDSNKTTTAKVAVKAESTVYKEQIPALVVNYTTKVKTDDKKSNPWYKSVWCWLLVLVVGGGASYGTYYVVSKKQKNKK